MGEGNGGGGGEPDIPQRGGSYIDEIRDLVFGNVVNGMVDVTAPTNCMTLPCDEALRNDINAALGMAFGIPTSGLADHVLHCMPPGSMVGIACAFINSWLSIYSNFWCNSPTVLIHRVNHNLLSLPL